MRKKKRNTGRREREISSFFFELREIKRNESSFCEGKSPKKKITILNNLNFSKKNILIII